MKKELNNRHSTPEKGSWAWPSGPVEEQCVHTHDHWPAGDLYGASKQLSSANLINEAWRDTWQIKHNTCFEKGRYISPSTKNTCVPT